MKIRILRWGQNAPLRAAIATAVLECGYMVTIKHPWLFFEMPDWQSFLTCFLSAASACSRDWRGRYVHDKVHVEVIMDDGRMFGTDVWIPEDNRGVRYGSLA